MVDLYNILKNNLTFPSSYIIRYQDIEENAPEQIGIYFSPGSLSQEVDGEYTYMELYTTFQIQTTSDNNGYVTGESICDSIVSKLNNMRIASDKLDIIDIRLESLPGFIGRSKKLISIYTVNFLIKLNKH